MLRSLLERTAHFSRPAVSAFPIQTGPQAQERDGQFAAGGGPAIHWFGIMSTAFWTQHILLLFKDLMYHWTKRVGTSDAPSYEKRADIPRSAE
jgi:hypothetical protein